MGGRLLTLAAAEKRTGWRRRRQRTGGRREAGEDGRAVAHARGGSGSPAAKGGDLRRLPGARRAAALALPRRRARRSVTCGRRLPQRRARLPRRATGGGSGCWRNSRQRGERQGRRPSAAGGAAARRAEEGAEEGEGAVGEATGCGSCAWGCFSPRGQVA